MIVSGFIKFHISLGWTGVAFGFLAMVLRAPDLVSRWWRAPPCARRAMETLHTVSGMIFIACSIFMPITANWIWPRYGTPYDVVWFITTMFLAMLLGVACIRLRRYFLFMSNEHGSSFETERIVESSKKEYLVLKYMHAIFMTYSLVMLLGAGQAFLANSRMNQFPYPPDEIVTDSLIGRCYGRNLVEPSAPSWLSILTCGLTSYCQESSRGGGPNPYYQENRFI